MILHSSMPCSTVAQSVPQIPLSFPMFHHFLFTPGYSAWAEASVVAPHPCRARSSAHLNSPNDNTVPQVSQALEEGPPRFWHISRNCEKLLCSIDQNELDQNDVGSGGWRGDSKATGHTGTNRSSPCEGPGGLCVKRTLRNYGKVTLFSENYV